MIINLMKNKGKRNKNLNYILNFEIVAHSNIHRNLLLFEYNLIIRNSLIILSVGIKKIAVHFFVNCYFFVAL